MVGSTEDARISPYLLLFWTILEGWVGFSKVKSFSLKSSQSRDLTILSTCQGSGSRSFHLVCLRILELVFFIFLLRRLSGSQSWVRQHGIGRLSGTDGELHLCLPGNTQVSLIQSTACLMDNDLIILKTHFLSSLFFLASIVSFLSPPSDLAASLVWDIQSNLAIRLIF